MEWILFVIIIGVVIAIIALPIWLMLNVNLFLGIGVICLYDFIIYKCCDVPAISVITFFRITNRSIFIAYCDYFVGNIIYNR